DMAVLVTDGTERDARRLSLGANATHGRARSNDDKRHVVNVCLNDPEWKTWSNYEIAKACGVSEHLVRLCKKHAGEGATTTGRSDATPQPTRYTTKHGT